MAKHKLPAADVTEDPHYHDTWTLLRKYRDVVWSLEVSVRQVRNRFRIDYGKTIEDFLESVYLAGADLSGTELEHQAKCIEQSHKMLCLVDSAVDLMRAKHKNGEEFYWLLYYAYIPAFHVLPLLRRSAGGWRNNRWNASAILQKSKLHGKAGTKICPLL